MNNQEIIKYLDWQTGESKIYTPGPREKKLNLFCALDHTPLTTQDIDTGWEFESVVTCPNCGEDYSHLKTMCQSELDELFKLRIENYKKMVIELKEKEKDLSLRIKKAEQEIHSQSLPKCTIGNCAHSCRGITCEKSC